MKVCIGISDHTTPEYIDSYFTKVWSHKKKLSLIIDTTQCHNISLKKFLTIKRVLNKHRTNSRKYLKHSTIYVSKPLHKTILETGLYFIKSETPTTITIK